MSTRAQAINAKSIGRLHRSLNSEDTAQLVLWAIELMHLRAHKSDIERLTGLPSATLASVAKGLFAGSTHGAALMRTGRLPTSLGEVLSSPSLHIEATLFLRLYADLLAAEGLTRDGLGFPHLPSFVRAAKMSATLVTATRSVVEELESDDSAQVASTSRGASDGLLDPKRLQISYALLLATSYHAGELGSNTCSACRATFMVTLAPTKVREGITHGKCPICRNAQATGLHMRAPNPVSDSDKKTIASRVAVAAAGAKQGQTTQVGISEAAVARMSEKGRPRSKKSVAPSEARPSAPMVVNTPPKKKSKLPPSS